MLKVSSGRTLRGVGSSIASSGISLRFRMSSILTLPNPKLSPRHITGINILFLLVAQQNYSVICSKAQFDLLRPL